MPIRGKTNPFPAKKPMRKGMFKTQSKDAQMSKGAAKAMSEAMANKICKNGAGKG